MFAEVGGLLMGFCKRESFDEPKKRLRPFGAVEARSVPYDKLVKYLSNLN